MRRDPDKPRLNETLDHVQARQPFLYNLGTGAVIGVVLLLFGFHGGLVLAYVVCWAALRAYLWGDGHVLRRQYDERQVRVAAEQAAKRKRT